MPTYSLLGISIFVPDFNDLYNAVVTPVINAVESAAAAIIAPIQSAVSYVWAQVAAALTSAASFIEGGLSALGSTVMGLLGTAYSDLVGLGTALGNGIATLGHDIVAVATTAYDAVSGFFQTYVLPAVNAIGADITGAFGSVFNFLSAIPGQVGAALGNLGSTIASDLGAIRSDIQGVFGSILGSLTSAVYAIPGEVAGGLNTLKDDVGGFLSSVGQALEQIGAIIWQAFNQFVIAPIEAGLSAVGNAISQGLGSIQSAIRNGILALVPKTPDQAFNTALDAAELGIATFLVGETIGIVADFVHPIKQLGVRAAFEKGLEVVGITTVAATLYGSIVESGWGVQLKYFFQYNYQYVKIDPGTAVQAVYYGVRTTDQLQEDLKWEGFSPDYIAAKLATLYPPINPRILTTLMEDAQVDNDFVQRELQKSGIDPAVLPVVVKALQFRLLKPFESAARSLVYSMYKDGFADQATAQGIMAAFGTPQNQQSWVLTLANYEFQYALKKELALFYVAEFKKGTIPAADAVTALTNLGMEPQKASVQVAVAGLQAAGALTKAQKAEVLQEALALQVAVS